MKRITAYETEDGQIFANDYLAQQHEKNIKRREAVSKLLKSAVGDDLPSFNSAFKVELIDWLVNNRDVIVLALE